MKTRSGSLSRARMPGKWYEVVSASGGADLSAAKRELPVGRSTPPGSAHGPSLRICGLSRYRCLEHSYQEGCGRILCIASGVAGNASGAR